MMIPSSLRRRAPRSLLLLALLATLLGLTPFGCRPAPKSDLEPGKAVVREIGGSEVHTYRLPLEEDTYLRMRIDQPGIDVTAKLVGPGGKEVGFFEEPQRLEEPDRLAWISKAGGEYRLVVRAHDPKAARGKYRVTLQERAGARRRDADRLSAERDYEEGRRLLATGTEEAKQRSLGLFRRSLEVWQNAGDRIGQIDALIQIAQVYNALSQSNAAISSAEKALAIARELSYREGVARALAAQGDAYQRIGDRDRALSSFEQSVPQWEALQDLNLQGTALYSIGTIVTTPDPEKAFKYFESALPLLHEAGNRGVEAYARTAEGWIQLRQGKSGDALENAKVALSLGESAKDNSAIASTHFLLGGIHKQRGELAEALFNLNRSLEMYVLLGDRDPEAYIRQGLGSVYFNLGEFGQAIEQYAKAFDLVKDPLLKARVLINTGYVHQQGKHDPKTALQYYGRALDLLGKSSSDSARALALSNIGAAQVLLGNPREGLSFLLQALRQKQQAKDIGGQASTLVELGTAYRALGDLRQAKDSYQQALRISSELGNTDLQAECLYRWAWLNRSEGALPEALQRTRDSLAIVESVRGQVASDNLRTSFFASKRDYYELLVNLLTQLERDHPGKYQQEALEASEWARARSLLDLLAEDKIRQGIPPALQRRDTDLRSRLSWLQGQLSKSPSAKIAREMEQVQGELTRLQLEIQKGYERYAAVRYPKPLRFEQIESLVDDRSVLLHYFVGEESSYLFVVNKQGVKIHSLPKSSELAEQVTRLRRSIEGRGPRYLRAYQQAATTLYSALLEPAAAALKGKARLLVAPDGPLDLLPFEALLTGNQGTSYADLPYLLRRFAISYVPSASVLADLQRSRQAVKPGKLFLAFADPSYGGARNTGMTLRGAASPNGLRGLVRLPDSGLEVKRIAALFPAGTSALYLGDEATKKNLEQNPYLTTAPRVHLALHGIVDPDRPERSGLELADGRLQVFDIFNLKLNADLLTLSACDTALGQQVRGEGMIGLTRAFLYAGARSLVVSLWPVADRSTADLMYVMYRNLGSGKVEALRQAKLEMVSSRKYSEPYYWAPFILSGDPH